MIGLVFTELLALIEDHGSPLMVERVLARTDPAHGGTSASIGCRPHEEVAALLMAWSLETGAALDQLARAYGHRLMQRGRSLPPPFAPDALTLAGFLALVDGSLRARTAPRLPEAAAPILCRRAPAGRAFSRLH